MPGAPAPLAVQPWPGATPVARDGVLVIGVAGAAGRGDARARLRLALREALAAVLHIPLEQIVVASTPGQAPRLTLAGAPAGLSLSHEEGLSLAAVNLKGAVGVDLMRVQDLPDWRAVAHDYLGPALAGTLAREASERRALAFARAWTAREAALKCAGMALLEWTPATAALDCRCLDLALPEGLAGTLALPRSG
ncbi:4'-phosphopantetheinyl transferase family protein [Janthinobacterium sp.]|uniref:4'-phosphopantetheinyl transferase family protein n=1 Tax=Janthinobacterium sp. TaxID=1871054 RepID=UPI00293D2CC7|nr:4'-phosphopantetheinyl transferase superfamily protein [Janthinobacterium sp.]